MAGRELGWSRAWLVASLAGREPRSMDSCIAESRPDIQEVVPFPRRIRRGYQVCRGVCATCHSLNRIAFRNMDGVCYTSAEIKDMAAEVRRQRLPDALASLCGSHGSDQCDCCCPDA